MTGTPNSSAKVFKLLDISEDAFAGDGNDEWQNCNDVISRQVKYIREKKCAGFALYSSSYINFSETFLADELNNLKNVL